MPFYPQILTFIGAELIFLLVRSQDFIIILKSKSQRSSLEQHQIDRGLFRGIFVEAFLFVPASAALILLISPILLPSNFLQNQSSVSAAYTLIGVASYGFPFATVKRIITRLALNTLREFVKLLPEKEQSGSQTPEGGSDE